MKKSLLVLLIPLMGLAACAPKLEIDAGDTRPQSEPARVTRLDMGLNELLLNEKEKLDGVVQMRLSIPTAKKLQFRIASFTAINCQMGFEDIVLDVRDLPGRPIVQNQPFHLGVTPTLDLLSGDYDLALKGDFHACEMVQIYFKVVEVTP